MKTIVVIFGYFLALMCGWFGWQFSLAYGSYLFTEHSLESQYGALWFFATTLIWAAWLYGLVASSVVLIAYSQIAKTFNVNMSLFDADSKHGFKLVWLLILTSVGSCAGGFAGLPDNQNTEFLYKPSIEATFFRK